jgi:hypothetical protein
VAERAGFCNQYQRMLKAFVLFTLTAVAEIFGCYAVYLWLRLEKPAWWWLPGRRRSRCLGGCSRCIRRWARAASMPRMAECISPRRWRGSGPWKDFDPIGGTFSEVFGAEVALVRVGGAIPIVADFRDILGTETLLIGLGLPDCRMHSPNENFPLENLEAGIRLNHVLLRYLAE